LFGNFTYSQAKDTYEAEIKTLTLLLSKVAFRPTDGKNAKGPSYRAVIEGAHGSFELGAAWKRKSEQGREFLSVTLDDPALMYPMSAALMPEENGNGAILIWARPVKRQAEAA
jgi:uncharacterized protein (DUF736 family)